MRRGLTLMWEEAERGTWEEGKVLLKIWGRNEMKQRSCNGNNSSLTLIWQCTGKGPTRSFYLPHLPLSFSFQLLKTPKSCFRFLSSKLKILSFWVMETIIQNQAKHLVIYGTHSFWMIDHENWVISLSFGAIQTSSKCFKPASNLPCLPLLCASFPYLEERTRWG